MIEWVAVTDAVFYFVWAGPHDSHCGAICEGIHPFGPALVASDPEGSPPCEDFAGGARDPETAPVIAVAATSWQTVDGVSLGLSCHFADISCGGVVEVFWVREFRDVGDVGDVWEAVEVIEIRFHL